MLSAAGDPVRVATVGRLHGRSAPEVRDAASRRRLASADPVEARLIEIALNAGTENQHAIAAIVQVLNRSGVVAPAVTPLTRVQARCFGRSFRNSIDRHVRLLLKFLGKSRNPLRLPQFIPCARHARLAATAAHFRSGIY